MNKFSFDSVNNFDDHINTSIKGYDLLDSLIINISSFFIKKNTTIIDIGCTSGRLINKLCEIYDVNALGYDIIDNQFLKGKAKLIKQDITDNNFQIPVNNLSISVFTLQFIDINERLNVLKKIYNSLNINGCFIFCEKEICGDGILQEVFTFSNYDNKKNNFTADEILKKEYDLRNIMNSLNKNQNIDLLKKAGFKVIETFFQSLNFKGYICRK